MELRKTQISDDHKFLKDLGEVISAGPFNPDESFQILNCFLFKGCNWELNQFINHQIFYYVKDSGLYGTDIPSTFYKFMNKLGLRNPPDKY